MPACISACTVCVRSVCVHRACTVSVRGVCVHRACTVCMRGAMRGTMYGAIRSVVHDVMRGVVRGACACIDACFAPRSELGSRLVVSTSLVMRLDAHNAVVRKLDAEPQAPSQ